MGIILTIISIVLLSVIILAWITGRINTTATAKRIILKLLAFEMRLTYVKNNMKYDPQTINCYLMKRKEISEKIRKLKEEQKELEKINFFQKLLPDKFNTRREESTLLGYESFVSEKEKKI